MRTDGRIGGGRIHRARVVRCAVAVPIRPTRPRSRRRHSPPHRCRPPRRARPPSTAGAPPLDRAAPRTPRAAAPAAKNSPRVASGRKPSIALPLQWNVSREPQRGTPRVRSRTVSPCGTLGKALSYGRHLDFDPHVRIQQPRDDHRGCRGRTCECATPEARPSTARSPLRRARCNAPGRRRSASRRRPPTLARCWRALAHTAPRLRPATSSSRSRTPSCPTRRRGPRRRRLASSQSALRTSTPTRCCGDR